MSAQHGSSSRYMRIHQKRSNCETGPCTPSPVAADTTLFPSRLPWNHPPGKSGNRRGPLGNKYWEAYHWMHMLWGLFNFLDSGSPSSTQAIVSSVDRAIQGEWTALHESYARTVFAKLLKYCAHPRGTMDRGPAKLNELITRIKNSQYDPSLNLDTAMCGAKEVDPSRISLPEQGGILDPRNHLSGQRLQQFLAMPAKIPQACSFTKDKPACHKVDPERWPSLLRKLHDADMITFLLKKDVLAEGRKNIKGGLFCVPHKPESDRLINERRPLNARERRLEWCQLPAGPMLSQLILSKTESVRASGDDLSNYFYLIKHLDEWQHRNCFREPVKGKLMPGLGLNPNEWYLPAFKVVCMRDTNGLDLAQATHEAILREVGCVHPSQTLVYGNVFPSSST